MTEIFIDVVPSLIPSKEGLEFLEWSSIRVRRDRLLRETDHTQVQDSPLSDAQRAQAAAYRKLLRDVPQDVGDPFTVVWPEKPDFLK
ncbi:MULTISPECIES: tail fiber assembly protein [unclassified Pseudomonas]|uniref:tail fiber assembly protein n=1 Tax=unclassified Pseudomonas TaxID=196821 RepID=UPI002115A5D5|nr:MULTISPECIES: tail fiber assembly protein [unclassified Pseudomonas]